MKINGFLPRMFLIIISSLYVILSFSLTSLLDAYSLSLVLGMGTISGLIIHKVRRDSISLMDNFSLSFQLSGSVIGIYWLTKYLLLNNPVIGLNFALISIIYGILLSLIASTIGKKRNANA